jgi:hypothetical protein
MFLFLDKIEIYWNDFRIASDEEDNDTDQEENKERELETAVSRQEINLHQPISTELNSNGHEYILINRSIPQNEEREWICTFCILNFVVMLSVYSSSFHRFHMLFLMIILIMILIRLMLLLALSNKCFSFCTIKKKGFNLIY